MNLKDTRDAKSLLSLYKLYTILRDYVHHEDELIHQRTSWNWGIQGFLFTAYAISIQKVMDASEKFAPAGIGVEKIYGERQLEYLIWFIPIVGILVSYFSLNGIRAADKSIRSLAGKWNVWNRPATQAGDDTCERDKSSEAEYELPRLICGYVEPESLFKLPHAFIPAMFIGVWLVLLVSWVTSKL
jgi:hypothetical protein